MNRTDERLTTDDLRRMLRSAYGPTLAPTGHDFAVALVTAGPSSGYLARLANEQQVVVRIAPDEQTPLLTHEADLLSSEVEALQVIAEHTGVPVPAMHHHDDSHELVGAEWYAREYLPGRPLAQLTPTDQELAGLRAELDGAARALHGITGDGFGRFQQPTLDSWQDAFSGLVEDALADAQRLGVELGVERDRVHAALLSHGTALDEVDTPVFCPWAFGLDDVVVDDEAHLVGIVQPDRVFWADPLLGAGRLGSAGELSPQGQTRVALYRLYAALVAVVEGAARPTAVQGAGTERARQRLLTSLEALNG
ncbi:aminoglycoside phosphotransferase family protein [Luteococcus sp. H138]|uniref:phosphotransferase family protein n=1 Tax=unclassified Luteococcus TaxID=2639923 RepID=UPI00313B29C7